MRTRSILAPVDFSPPSVAAAKYALALGAQVGASVTLLHVVDLVSETFPAPEWASVLLGQKTSEARAKLEAFAAALGRRGRPPETATVAGTPVEQILLWARTQAVDLIVMGTHGRSGLSHLWFGSVAERVLRSAPCPTLTVRTPAKQEGSAADDLGQWDSSTVT